VSLICCHSSNW